MRLVLAALSRPITVVVALLAIALCAVLAIQRMPVDIFPQVGDPAIYVSQPYSGMDPAQMEGYMTYYYEYHFLYITGIEHVESKSIQGATLMKLVFHEGTNMSQAMSETVGYVNRARSFMPPGTVPPFITRFCGQRRSGPACFQQPESYTRRIAGLRDQSRAPVVCDSARCFRTTSVRREPENDRSHSGSREAAPVPGCAGRSDRGGQQINAGHAFRKHVDGQSGANRPNERGSRRKPGGVVEHADPAGLRDNCLPARHRND